jgi:protoheme IX farnesyltransferase
VPNKGDVSWMLVSTLLVIMMAIPGLALFYGGLVRSKNMLSVLMQVFVTLIAPGFHQLHPFPGFIAMLCLAVGAGAAGAINMWFDRDIDAVMHSTRFRPLPMGRVIDPRRRFSFGIILSLASVVMMGLALNWLAAALLAAA